MPRLTRRDAIRAAVAAIFAPAAPQTIERAVASVGQLPATAPLLSRLDASTIDLLVSSDPLQHVIDTITTKLLQAQAKAIDREWSRITTPKGIE